MKHATNTLDYYTTVHSCIVRGIIRCYYHSRL